MQILKSKALRATLCAFLIVVGMVMVGCRGGQQQRPPMDEATMVDFLTEAYMLEGFLSIESNYRYKDVSAQTEKAYNELLDRFGYSKEDFEASMLYYAQHGDVNERIHQEVMQRLESI